MIRSHRECCEHWPPVEQFQETAITWVKDSEFRTSLDVIAERKMGEAEFAELVGLLVETVKRLFEATGNITFEAVKLSGVYQGVTFQAWWTWYSFTSGIAGACREITHALSHRVEL